MGLTNPARGLRPGYTSALNSGSVRHRHLVGRRRNLLAKLGGWDDPCIISKQPAVSLVSSIEQNNASEMRPLLEVTSAPQIMDLPLSRTWFRFAFSRLWYSQYMLCLYQNPR